MHAITIKNESWPGPFNLAHPVCNKRTKNYKIGWFLSELLIKSGRF